MKLYIFFCLLFNWWGKNISRDIEWLFLSKNTKKCKTFDRRVLINFIKNFFIDTQRDLGALKDLVYRLLPRNLLVNYFFKG